MKQLVTGTIAMDGDENVSFFLGADTFNINFDVDGIPYGFTKPIDIDNCLIDKYSMEPGQKISVVISIERIL